MKAPDLSPLITLMLDMGAPKVVENAPDRLRRFIPILGGVVSGRYEGEVLPGGGDWQTVLDDGRLEIDAHYVLSLDGRPVEVVSQGVRSGPPEVLARLARGEAVDPSEYYFRTSIRLFAADAGLAHLNQRMGLAVGARQGDQVRIEIFEVG